MPVYRDLIRHSAVYGVGQILTRLASILLLPVYTRALSPADYGVIAIFDLVTSLLAILVASGVQRAVSRHHFDDDTTGDREDGLWWTGVGILGLLSLCVVVPGLVWARPVSELLVGPLDRGPLYFRLVLLTFAAVCLEQLLQAHLRVSKRSVALVSLSLLRLVVNVSLNLFFLFQLELGLLAIFLGNLLSGVFSVLVLGVMFTLERGRPQFRSEWLGPLFRYGGPLVLASFMAVGLHQADRYLIRLLLDLSSAGIYSVAYMVGQGLNTLILTPFSQIWFVAIYEIDKQPERDRAFAVALSAFVAVLGLVMLSVSLLSVPIFHVLVDEAFWSGARLVPLVCLAYFFFSLHVHFVVPALLAKRTQLTLPAHVAALATNVSLNLLLIPRLGIEGAAIASVASFALFSMVGLWVYRRIEVLPYRLDLLAIDLVGVVLTFWIWSRFASWEAAPVRTAVSACGLWLAWAAILGRQVFQGKSLRAVVEMVRAAAQRQRGQR